MPIGIYTNI